MSKTTLDEFVVLAGDADMAVDEAGYDAAERPLAETKLAIPINTVVKIDKLDGAIALKQRNDYANIHRFVRIEPHVVRVRRTQGRRQAWIGRKGHFQSVSMHTNGVEVIVRLARIVAEIDGAAKLIVNGGVGKPADEVVSRDSHGSTLLFLKCASNATYILYHIFSQIASNSPLIMI